jgi:hypothetical protein
MSEQTDLPATQDESAPPVLRTRDQITLEYQQNALVFGDRNFKIALHHEAIKDLQAECSTIGQKMFLLSKEQAAPDVSVSE